MMTFLCAFLLYSIFVSLQTIISGKCVFQFYSDRSSQGNFSSPHFPAEYAESLECVYGFHGREHETLRLTFHDFDLEPPFRKGCLTDYIDVSTITIVGNKFLVGRYCGREVPGSMLFMNPHAEIIFKTNHVIQGKGFLGTYYFQDEERIPPPQSTANVSQCGGSVSGVGGVIVSPGFPYYFPKDVECIWLIRVHYHQRIYVRLLKMQLYGSIANCAESELTIYDGYSSISFNPKVLRKYCGDLRYYKNVEEQTQLSARNRVLIRFKTSASQIMKGEDLDKNAVGFKITWTAVDFKKEGECTEFRCRDSRYCLSSADSPCSEMRDYCIDASLVCDGRTNCANEDGSDEDGCNLPLVVGCGVVGGFLLLTCLLSCCFYRRRRASPSSHGLQLQQLEHSPTCSSRGSYYQPPAPNCYKVLRSEPRLPLVMWNAVEAPA